MKKPVTKRGVLFPLLPMGSGLKTVLLALALAVCLLAVPAAAAECSACDGCDVCSDCHGEGDGHYDCSPETCDDRSEYRNGFRTSGIIHAALDPVAAGEEENIKLWWDEDTRSQRGAEDFARSRSMWWDIPAGYGYLQSMLNFLEGPDGYTGGATVNLKVPKSYVTDRGYQLTDITVVQFRNVTSNTTPIAFPYEETLRLADVLEQKLKTDKENHAGVLNAIDTIRKELTRIQEDAGGNPVDQENARDLYRQMYDLVRAHYPDYIINAWVKVPARILFDDETVNHNHENWGSVILQAELSELDGPVTIIFLKGNDLTTPLERPAGA